MNVAIIPARGGSKRIPRKNVKLFHDKPMIAYTIEVAKSSGVFDRIIVSTDDEEIGYIAHSYGAEFPFRRPLELSDDYTGTTAVVAHAIRWLLDRNIDCTATCCLYATAPFLRPEQIRTGLHILQSQQWDYVFSATTFPYPIFRAFSIGADSGVHMIYPEHFTSRSQDLPEVWHDAAQFYWGAPEAWLEGRVIFGERSTVVRLPRWQVQDIDTMEDWNRAERLYQAMENQIDD
jgi:N-acylneuraminate cytidylyltransferase